ncbi:MAG: murein L,D-transpeptidase [Rhizobiaceae bacterium]|nr:MAG: murein L,D-transpeptidase [Rhizobiaceae bacterium]
MLARILVFSLSLAMLPVAAEAAPAPQADSHAAAAVPARPIAEGLRLAQAGDVEVYYDGRGRRVIVDAWTGEILAIERPDRGERQRELRRQQRERLLRERAARRQEQERYYLDDPEDMARLRRDMARERGYVLPEEEFGYRTYPEPPRDGLPRYSYPETYGNDPYRDGTEGRPEVYEEPEIVTRAPVQRQPLPDAGPRSGEGDPAAVDPIDPATPPSTQFTARDDVAALQVLLDRAGASPGVIDGRFGSNVDKALAAYRELTGENLKSTDAEGIQKALAASGGDPFITYTITPADAAGPYVASVPADYGQKAKLERLSYTSVLEMLAERFHMDEAYLKQINPDANFNRPGTIIKVANVGVPAATEVARIVADKGRKQVRAYGRDGNLVAAYPATIGSADTPSPTGTHMVSRVAFDPEYTYNPSLNFKQGNNDKVLTIPPGPNGPVGSIWIALDKPTYGIHGTPDPSKIGKTESHGCVRLTNWDAQELAKLVKPGVIVQFIN